jgi:hypothetical protein
MLTEQKHFVSILSGLIVVLSGLKPFIFKAYSRILTK